MAFNAVFAPMLNAQTGESVRFLVGHLAADLPLGRRVGLVVRALADPGGARRSLSAHCEAAARLAARLGMPDSVSSSLAHAYERWDGKGYPDGLAGEEVPIAIRVVTAARDADLWARQAGWATATEVLAHRRGRAYDPVVVDALTTHGESWLAGLGDELCAVVLDAEPAPVLNVDEDSIDAALGAVADFADLKSPFFRGHSPGVASLASAAAGAAGLSGREARDPVVPGSFTMWAQWVSRRALGSPGAAERRSVGTGASAHLFGRAGVVTLRTARIVRAAGWPPPRTTRQQRVPPWARR